MARPERNNVDYFPHPVTNGKKMFYIESKYGNDGYSTWYKILELLGETDYHFLNLNDEEQYMYLLAKCKISEEKLHNIICDLVRIKVFNKTLWEENKLIYCQKFVDEIEDAYSKRKNNTLSYEGLLIHLSSLGIRKLSNSDLKGVNKPQSIGKDRIGKDRILIWRDSFPIYKSEEQQAYEKLSNDNNFIEDRQKYHPGLNVKLSLQKAHEDYWSTEKAWKHKKKSKSENLDWLSTYKNSLAQRMNQVWYTRDELKSLVFNTREDRPIEDPVRKEIYYLNPDGTRNVIGRLE